MSYCNDFIWKPSLAFAGGTEQTFVKKYGLQAVVWNFDLQYMKQESLKQQLKIMTLHFTSQLISWLPYEKNLPIIPTRIHVKILDLHRDRGGVQQGKEQMQWAHKSQWIYKLCYAILYISNTVIIQNTGLTSQTVLLIWIIKILTIKQPSIDRCKYCCKCVKIYRMISFIM